MERELERLVPIQGVMILHYLGEGEVLGGEGERPALPGRETPPGVYE